MNDTPERDLTERACLIGESRVSSMIAELGDGRLERIVTTEKLQAARDALLELRRAIRDAYFLCRRGRGEEGP